METNAVSAAQLALNLGMVPQEEGGLVKEDHYPFDGPGRAGSGHAYYYFKPDVATQFHTLDCDEYWLYHAGDDLDVWLLHPTGKVEIRKFGASKGAAMCLYLKTGVAFAAKPVRPDAAGTMISAITIPRFSPDGFHLLDRDEVLRSWPETKAFFAAN